MSGYVFREEEDALPRGRLQVFEAIVVEAVGRVIEFWGFKRNQGCVWALLYLRGRPLSAQELQEELDLSKGAVSMLTRELEHWGVIRRVRAPGETVWRFAAETDLKRMIGRVVKEREAGMLARVREDLEEAEALARRSGDVPKEVLARLSRLRILAALAENAVRLFVDTAQLNARPALEVLEGEGKPSKKGRKKR